MALLQESIKTSIHSYNKAFDLFKEIRELWDNLEGASDYQYMEALDKVDDLQKQVNKVDLRDMEEYLEREGKATKLGDVEHNLKLWKEAAYQIGREILGWSYYEDLIDATPRFITALKKKYPSKHKTEKQELVKKFVSLITRPDNVERYKSNIEAILRGTMTLPYFSRIFDALIDEGIIVKKTGIKAKPFYPRPPSMFAGKAKEEWKESKKQSKEEWKKRREEMEFKTDLSRKKPRETKRKGKNIIITPEGRELQYDFVTKNAQGIITYFRDQKKQYSYLGESFLSLLKYKKINQI